MECNQCVWQPACKSSMQSHHHHPELGLVPPSSCVDVVDMLVGKD